MPENGGAVPRLPYRTRRRWLISLYHSAADFSFILLRRRRIVHENASGNNGFWVEKKRTVIDISWNSASLAAKLPLNPSASNDYFEYTPYDEQSACALGRNKFSSPLRQSEVQRNKEETAREILHAPSRFLRPIQTNARTLPHWAKRQVRADK